MKRASAGTYPSYKQAVKRQKVKRQHAVIPRNLPQGAAPYRKHTEEKKNFDTDAGSSLLAFGTATANVLSLFEPINGTGPTQHQGREVTMKSLHVRWQVSIAATGTGSASLRCLVVYDRQSNTLQATTAQVLAADEITSPMNLNNNKRFTILMDEFVDCIGTGGPQSALIQKFVKLNHVVEFNQTNGGTFADITTGNVVCLLYQSGGLLIANPTGNFYSRVRFVDA